MDTMRTHTGGEGQAHPEVKLGSIYWEAPIHTGEVWFIYGLWGGKAGYMCQDPIVEGFDCLAKEFRLASLGSETFSSLYRNAQW